jgi:hypothetical protein
VRITGWQGEETQSSAGEGNGGGLCSQKDWLTREKGAQWGHDCHLVYREESRVAVTIWVWIWTPSNSAVMRKGFPTSQPPMTAPCTASHAYSSNAT